VTELDRGPGGDNDMYRGSQVETVKAMAYNLATSRFGAYQVQAEASRKLNDLSNTRAVIRKMKEWLDNNPGDFPFPEWTYMVQRAHLAEAEGHGLDALAYYQQALHRLDNNSAVRERARALWEAQGGSRDAFEIWAGRAALSAKVTPPRPPIASSTNLSWSNVGKPLAALKALDLNGKTWTVADLKGKTTFINVWATWCSPCLTELPQVQALFNLVKDRQDIQVITISVDENPGLLAAFMKKEGYGFPVLLARPLVDDVTPSFSIPRNWVINHEGILRLESIGFDGRAKNWPQQMLEKLKQPVN